MSFYLPPLDAADASESAIESDAERVVVLFIFPRLLQAGSANFQFQSSDQFFSFSKFIFQNLAANQRKTILKVLFTISNKIEVNFRSKMMT